MIKNLLDILLDKRKCCWHSSCARWKQNRWRIRRKRGRQYNRRDFTGFFRVNKINIENVFHQYLIRLVHLVETLESFHWVKFIPYILKIENFFFLKYHLNSDAKYITFQEMWKCTYIETSAKKNYNIEAIFQEILTLEQKRQLELKVEEEKVCRE